MTTIRRIVVSQIDGDNANNTTTDEIRPFGETAFYIDNSDESADKLVLMMFDGIRTHRKSKVLSPGVLFGSNADAGDGSNADTIKLIPDADLFANGSNQYIVVDPTGGEPGHIHLRAGGTQDSSSADLYLGGELTCVRVSDTSGFVTVRTTNVGDPNITMDWTFNTDGNLYFPGIGNNRIGESEPGLVVSSDNSVVLQSNNNGESRNWFFGTDGSLTFPDSTTQTTAAGFYVAGDDSTARFISAGETLQIVGAGGASVTTNSEGKITVTAGGGGGGVGETVSTLEFTQSAYNEDFWIGDWVYFAKANNTVAADVIDTGLTITRDANGGIYNSAIEVSGQWWNQPDSSLISPVGTEWNNGGWQDLSDVTERNYSVWLATAGYYAGHLPGTELVMHDIANDKYYAVQFLSWQIGNQGGGFSYRRRQINTSIYFSKPNALTDLGLTDAIAPGLVLARGPEDGGAGLFNTAAGETAWDQNLSPVGTLWNAEGWNDLSNYTSRQYLNFRSVTKNINAEYANVVGMELIMHDTINNEYYAIMFTAWNNSTDASPTYYPGYRYVRRKLNAINTKQGLTFVDGSIQQKAITEKRLGILPAWKFRTNVSGNSIALNQTHAGKHLLINRPLTTVNILDTTQAPIEVGSIFTIICQVGADERIDIQLVNDNESSNDSNIYGAGTANFGKRWRCTDQGGGAIVTLIKLDSGLNNSAGEARSTWMISGHNLEIV